MPYLTLPDGTKFGQARAILRYIGKHTGLYPEDPLAALRVDELMDALDEYQGIVNAVGQGLPQEEKEAAPAPKAVTLPHAWPRSMLSWAPTAPTGSLLAIL
mmetsp:Transcript_17271/g.44867  ORF Transcript_17271/g.44867 Transcript_17271/m.44867 type:complete len:101 (+) Transcript_17271:100-402(+)